MMEIREQDGRARHFQSDRVENMRRQTTSSSLHSNGNFLHVLHACPLLLDANVLDANTPV
jgi:hypothetical protein